MFVIQRRNKFRSAFTMLGILIEAVTLSVIGGIIGIALGVGDPS